jgi:hypothetical protein
MRLVKENNIRADISWNEDNSAILVKPNPDGMVKLYKGSGEACCSANRLVSSYDAPNFFDQGTKYKSVEIHWFGDDRAVFYDDMEYDLFSEARNNGLDVQPISALEGYADLEINVYPIEITCTKPSDKRSTNGPHGARWGIIANRILGLVIHKQKTGENGILIIPIEWVQQNHLSEYKQILSENLGIEIIFTDFNKDWAKKVLDQILEIINSKNQKQIRKTVLI